MNVWQHNNVLRVLKRHLLEFWEFLKRQPLSRRSRLFTSDVKAHAALMRPLHSAIEDHSCLAKPFAVPPIGSSSLMSMVAGQSFPRLLLQLLNGQTQFCSRPACKWLYSLSSQSLWKTGWQPLTQSRIVATQASWPLVKQMVGTQPIFLSKWVVEAS